MGSGKCFSSMRIPSDDLGKDQRVEEIPEDMRVHIHQIDNTLEAFLFADRKLNRDRIALQSVMHHIQHMKEIGAHDIHLVHIDHAGNMIVVRLPPNGFGLRLYAALCT